MSDTLPAGVTYESASTDHGVTPTFSNGVVSATFSTLDPGAQATLTIAVVPTVAPGNTLSDTASVTGQNPDPNQANNSATLLTPVVGVSDLGIAIASAPDSAYVGQNITYTLDVSNAGPDDEPNAVLTLPFPTDLALVSTSPTPGKARPGVSGGLFTADLGSLAANSTAAFTLTLNPKAAAAGTLVTKFTVQGDNLDPSPANNTAQASVTVTPSADLSVAISPSAAPPAHLAEWTYTLSVADLGPSPATGVMVLAPLPPGAAFVSSTASQGPGPAVQSGMLSADLGDLAPGQVASVTIVVQPIEVAPLQLAASVSGSQYDPTLANNHASLTVLVSPSANLTMNLVPQYPTVSTGQDWTFTATVGNSGPDPATDVALEMPLASQLVFDSSEPSQITSIFQSGQLDAQLGTIAPGFFTTFSVVVTAQTAGLINQSATATDTEYQLDPGSSHATTSVNVLESAGILQFGSRGYAVPETAGLAQLQVVRSDGSLGSVTVNYQTVAVNATPGLDYTPTSGTLTFASGQTTATIDVPVLADPWDNHDEYVSVVLGSPTGGAGLGALDTTLVRIIDVDPNTTPPEVSSLTWNGTSRSITSLTVSFTAPLNQSFAMIAGNYQLVAQSMGNRVISLTPQSYNGSSFSVTLVPSMPLPSRQYYQLGVVGTGPNAIRDIAGNILDGAANGLPGSNYDVSFAQGTRLQYVDAAGNKVSLKLTGSGYMEQVRDASGDGILLELVGIDPHHATLSGSVRKTVSVRARARKSTSGTTSLGTLEGFGNFGDVKVLLKSPPFYVTQYPFQRKGRGVL